MKNYIFRKTAGTTAKANNLQKVDNRNLLDYSYILQKLEELDTEIYNNLNFSPAAICEKFRAAMQQYNNINCFEIGGYIYIKLNFYPFFVVVEAFTDHYCINDDDRGKQLYKIHAADNCRIHIFHEMREYAIFSETYNPAGLQTAGRYYGINISFRDNGEAFTNAF